MINRFGTSGHLIADFKAVAMGQAFPLGRIARVQSLRFRGNPLLRLCDVGQSKNNGAKYPVRVSRPVWMLQEG